MHQKILFFVGTEAELIKLFPIMIECNHKNLEYAIIASGQNNIYNSPILDAIGGIKPELILSDEKEISKNAIGLLIWYIKTYRKTKKKLSVEFSNSEDLKPIIIVHGDTVSTLMGAYIGEKLGMIVCHVEAGLRSHHLLNPFPEEIDRLLTSRKAEYHFAPGDAPVTNLKTAHGKIINTRYNTIIDSLRYAMNRTNKLIVNGIDDAPYFVFVLHRQENLLNKNLVCNIIEQIKIVSKNMKCVMILHKITELALQKYHLLDTVKENQNIITLPRMEYFDFMKLLHGSEFVMTDGGSNQEELHYMGKPCLILRNTTERNEGIGSNAVLYQGNMELLKTFPQLYKEKIISAKMESDISPSKIIVEKLEQIVNRLYQCNE